MTQASKDSRTIIVSDHEIDICFGNDCRDNRPIAATLSMTELATLFSTPDPGRGTLPLAEYLALDKTVKDQKAIRDAEKDGGYFITAAFTHAGTRDQADVKWNSAFTGDIDKGMVTKDMIEAKLKGHQYIAYSSYSHHGSAPRWRFIVPYATPASAADHKKAYAYFQHLFDDLLDTRAATTNQLWYTPACPPDAVEQFEFFVGQGDLLEVSDLPEVAAPALSNSTSPTTVGGAVRASIETLLRTVCHDGERTQHTLRLAGALIAAGNSLAECTTKCHTWNAQNQPPLDDEKIETICASIYNADLRNHPERHQNAANDPLFHLDDGRIGAFLNTAPPPRLWLIDGMIAAGKTGAVVAPGGSSKSQFLLQVGVSVATGVDLAEHWKVGETGGVMILCAEDDREEIHRRVHRIHLNLTARGLGKQLAPLVDRLFVFSTIGIDTLLTKRQPHGEVTPTAIIQRIAALAAQIPDLKLIVIDPVSRFRGGEENSNEDGTRFVEALELIAKLTGAAVLVAHHAGKASYSSPEVSQSASRGASSLTDGLRWQMNLSPPGEKQADALGVNRAELRRYVMATVTKSNYSMLAAPTMLEREDGGYLTAVTASQARRSAEMESIIRVLRVIDDAGGPLTARQLEDQYGGTRKATRLSKQRLREVIKLAIDQSLVLGPDRKPLSITPVGADMLKCMPPPDAPKADATRRADTSRRKKSVKNQ